MKPFFYVIIFLVNISIGCLPNESEEYLFKSDFEKSRTEINKIWNEVKSYKVDSCKLGISNNSKSGNQSFKIARVWCDAWSRAGIETKSLLPINHEKKYILSFWYKTENLNEYSLPLTVRFKVFRTEHEPLFYNKNISWSEFQWTQNYQVLENLPYDCDSVQIQLYTRFRTKGSIFIDDVKFKEAKLLEIEKFEIWRRSKIAEPVGKSNELKIKGTGYFGLHKGEKRWWLIDPEGNPNWSIGTMAAMPANSGNGNTELYKWYRRKYGNNPDGFAKVLYDSLTIWGFNSYAGWTSNYFAKISEDRFHKGESYFPMFRVLGLSRMGKKDYYVKDNKGNVKDGEHSTVDPFNPNWKQEAREKAESMIPEYLDKAWFVGWYVDNEVNLNDLFKFIWAEYSSREFIKVLKKKYKTVENLNSTWSSSFRNCKYKDFNDLLKDKPEPKDWDDPLSIDFFEFERIMIKEYIDFTYNLIKELDPNHIVISNRINLGPMSDLHRTMDLWGKYDLICMNIYPENLKIGFSEGELEIMKKLHRITGRPVIIGEWSVPAISKTLYSFESESLDRPLDWSWPQVVRDQKERGEVYNACMKQLSSLDFVVGAGWFKPIDVDSPSRRANRGLLNGNLKSYSEMTNKIQKTNLEIKEKMNID